MDDYSKPSSQNHWKKAILHCDLNNYFASVEIMKNPSLKDKIVVVGGDAKKRKGVVLAKNENAKAYGIKTGEPIAFALRKCANLICVPPSMDDYVKYSKIVRDIYYQYTDLIEPFGIDECWLDVTGSQALFGDAITIATKIKNHVKAQTNLTISVGVSFNKIFAKLGSDMKKPDAITIISPDNFKKKVYPLNVNELLMVGKKTAETLNRCGILTIGDLANSDANFLKSIIGTMGETMMQYARGNDTQAVISTSAPPKSISVSRTLPEDLKDNDRVRSHLLKYSAIIAKELRQNKLKCGGVSFYVKDSDFAHKESQKKLSNYTSNTDDIFRCAYDLFLTTFKWQKLIRSLGVKAYDLIDESASCQMNFFLDQEKLLRKETLERCVDKITNQYGEQIIKRAAFLNDEY